MKKLVSVFAVVSMVVSCLLYADAREHNGKLGRGINMGNMLEAPQEGEWGTPLDVEFFKIIRDKGFDSVRIPIRWSAEGRVGEKPPYKVSDEFFARTDEVIEAAMAQGLAVVINCHHYEELFNDLDKHWDRIIAIWQQVSIRYKDKPDTLMFEIMNEPHGQLNAGKWNELLAIIHKDIRKHNPTRPIVIGTAEWGGIGSLSKLQLPEGDENLILTVHYYSPFQFTHQGAEWTGEQSQAWLGTTWDGDYFEKKAVENDMAAARAFSEKHGIPVYVGEFGAYRKADMKSRVRWTAYCARKFEDMGFSWAYWEFCQGFGAYDPEKKAWREGLANALISDDTSVLNMPAEPKSGKGKNILANGDFAKGDKGWTFGAWQGAAEGAVEDGAFKVTITDPGTEGWNIQLLYTGLTLKHKKIYEVHFEAWSDAPRSISSGMENSENYASYGGSGFELRDEKQKFSYQLKKKDTDTNARLSFSFGGDNATVYIDNIKILEK